MWAVIEPLLPARDLRRGGRPRIYGDRPVLDAIFCVLRSGCQWRMVPHDLVPWWTAYRWYRTWAADGTWDAVHGRLRDLARAAAGKDPAPPAAVLDAQSVKTSEGGRARGVDMGKKITGRKRHLVTDTRGLVLVTAVTAAPVQDRPGGKAVLGQLAARFPSAGLAWADGGYANEIDDGLVRWAAQDLGVVLQIVRRNNDVKGLSGAATPLGDRADLRLAGPQPPPGPRLRTAHCLLGGDDQDCDDPADGRPPGRPQDHLGQRHRARSAAPDDHREPDRHVTTQLHNSHKGPRGASC
jgi:transposase